MEEENEVKQLIGDLLSLIEPDLEVRLTNVNFKEAERIRGIVSGAQDRLQGFKHYKQTTKDLTSSERARLGFKDLKKSAGIH
jgi:hypothetical protein